MTERSVEPVDLEGVYRVSEDVVAREIEGELVIVPLVAGIGDADDELFTLNDTGRAIWRRLDGVHTLRAVARDLSEEYEVTLEDVEHDVLGLVTELVKLGVVEPLSKAGA